MDRFKSPKVPNVLLVASFSACGGDMVEEFQWQLIE
jgi:hypothetical protein